LDDPTRPPIITEPVVIPLKVSDTEVKRRTGFVSEQASIGNYLLKQPANQYVQELDVT